MKWAFWILCILMFGLVVFQIWLFRRKRFF